MLQQQQWAPNVEPILVLAQTQEEKECKQCNKFVAHDGPGRHRNNCVTWLCNNGNCPMDVNPDCDED